MRLRRVRLRGETVVESFDDRRRSDHSTRFVARHLRIDPGSRVVEVGCGTGVLASLAFRRGAGSVWATDVDPEAVLRARETADASGATVDVLHGPLLDPVPLAEVPDLVVGVMPQKPSTVEFSVRFAGGRDGADLVVALTEAAAKRLRPGGRLVLYHHSLAAPSRVERALSAAFDWRVLAARPRCVAADSYARLAPGMLDQAMALAAAGVIGVRRRGAFLEWTSRVIEGVRR